jgi:hypothetical protein
MVLWERGEKRKRFLWGNLSEGDHLKNIGMDGRIILKLSFKKYVGRA